MHPKFKTYSPNHMAVIRASINMGNPIEYSYSLPSPDPDHPAPTWTRFVAELLKRMGGSVQVARNGYKSVRCAPKQKVVDYFNHFKKGQSIYKTLAGDDYNDSEQKIRARFVEGLPMYLKQLVALHGSTTTLDQLLAYLIGQEETLIKDKYERIKEGSMSSQALESYPYNSIPDVDLSVLSQQAKHNSHISHYLMTHIASTAPGYAYSPYSAHPSPAYNPTMMPAMMQPTSFVPPVEAAKDATNVALIAQKDAPAESSQSASAERMEKMLTMMQEQQKEMHQMKKQINSSKSNNSRSGNEQPRQQCRYYQQGNCFRGDKCRFSHDQQQQQQAQSTGPEKQ